MQHNAFFGPPTQWLAFERTTDGMTSICAMRLDNEGPAWRPDVVQISGLHPAGLVRSPDAAGTWYSSIPLRVVAWEQLTTNRWNIYYSTRSDTDLVWSDPNPLTEDTVDNTGVQLRPLDGEHVLATWRRGKDLVGSRIGYDGRVDTFLVGTSTLDGFEFDVNSGFYSGVTFLWVTQDSLGKRVFAIRSMTFDYLGQPKWESTQFVAYPFSVYNPWLVTENPPGLPIVAFEVRTGERTEVFVAFGQSIYNVTADTSADYGNPTGIFNPIITSSGAKAILRRDAAFLSGVSVVERRGPADSSLVFWPGKNTFSDTLKGPGANRSVIVGSPWIVRGSIAWTPVAWESNRTGRWHLYGTFVRSPMDGVPHDGGAAPSFSLAQNYPNPFNPSTAIRYELPKSSDVRLSVYDMLGREVEVLVNKKMEAGVHEVKLNGSNLASGVYVYRLTTGDFAQSKKLMILR